MIYCVEIKSLVFTRLNKPLKNSEKILFVLRWFQELFFLTHVPKREIVAYGMYLTPKPVQEKKFQIYLVKNIWNISRLANSNNLAMKALVEVINVKTVSLNIDLRKKINYNCVWRKYVGSRGEEPPNTLTHLSISRAHLGRYTQERRLSC